LILSRAATSPIPVAEPSIERSAVSVGLSVVPAKKCAALVPPKGTISALLRPRIDVSSSGTTTPKSTRSEIPYVT
jgi:hypothetical protein